MIIRLTPKMRRIMSMLLVLTLTFPTLKVLALEMTDPSGEESMNIEVADSVQNYMPNVKEVVEATTKETDFLIRTIGSFSLLFIVMIFGGLSYKTVIQNKELSLFGTTQKKQKYQNYVQ
jgi:hypothetical protein